MLRLTSIISVAVVVLITLFPGSVFAFGGYGWCVPGAGYGFGFGAGPMGWFGTILMFMLWLLVIMGFVALIQGLWRMIRGSETGNG